MDIKDLNIATEIFNLFNYTLNEDAKTAVKKLVTTPLASRVAITERQEILKGFMANGILFDTYSYSKIDYREAFMFLAGFNEEELLPKHIKLKLFINQDKFKEYRSKCVQLVLLLHRLHSLYVKPLKIGAFPEKYKAVIRLIDDFFNGMNTAYYEGLIRSNNFRIKHSVELLQLISAKKKAQQIQPFIEAYTLFEAYISISTGIRKHRFSFPEITEGNGITLNEFYHPLLQKPVKNSIATASNVILLTGPNMSGKSTLLKAISICIYLGNIGFGIPAGSGSLPVYNNISVFINLNDDLQSGYSHFMTEIINLKNVVTQATQRQKCFAVFDELFRGTNIDDALEISRTTLKGLLNFPDSLFLVSSHLHQLVSMDEIAGGQIACHYLDCNLADDVPAFTYRLKEGSSDIKIGRILFEKEGLNKMLNHTKK